MTRLPLNYVGIRHRSPRTCAIVFRLLVQPWHNRFKGLWPCLFLNKNSYYSFHVNLHFPPFLGSDNFCFFPLGFSAAGLLPFCFCFLFLVLSPTSIMAVVVVASVADHIILVGVFLWWVQRPTNGTPVSRLCPTGKRDSGLFQSRVTLHTTTTNHEA
jgi:hypothetical protein